MGNDDGAVLVMQVGTGMVLTAATAVPRGWLVGTPVMMTCNQCACPAAASTACMHVLLTENKYDDEMILPKMWGVGPNK